MFCGIKCLLKLFLGTLPELVSLQKYGDFYPDVLSVQEGARLRSTHLTIFHQHAAPHHKGGHLQQNNLWHLCGGLQHLSIVSQSSPSLSRIFPHHSPKLGFFCTSGGIGGLHRGLNLQFIQLLESFRCSYCVLH